MKLKKVPTKKKSLNLKFDGEKVTIEVPLL